MSERRGFPFLGITGERCDEPVLPYEMDEQPRPDANADERAYTLTVEEALLRYEAAGHGRTARALQKYCARGDLDCIKEETEYGQRYRITPASVARHLEQIEQVSQAKGRDQSRPDASVRSAGKRNRASRKMTSRPFANSRDRTRATRATPNSSKARTPICASRTARKTSSLNGATRRSKR